MGKNTAMFVMLAVCLLAANAVAATYLAADEMSGLRGGTCRRCYSGGLQVVCGSGGGCGSEFCDSSHPDCPGPGYWPETVTEAMENPFGQYDGTLILLCGPIVHCVCDFNKKECKNGGTFDHQGFVRIPNILDSCLF